MKILFVGDVHNHMYMFKDIERLDSQYNFDRIIINNIRKYMRKAQDIFNGIYIKNCNDYSIGHV